MKCVGQKDDSISGCILRDLDQSLVRYYKTPHGLTNERRPLTGGRHNLGIYGDDPAFEAADGISEHLAFHERRK